jgi:hypothetical protein
MHSSTEARSLSDMLASHSLPGTPPPADILSTPEDALSMHVVKHKLVHIVRSPPPPSPAPFDPNGRVPGLDYDLGAARKSSEIDEQPVPLYRQT